MKLHCKWCLNNIFVLFIKPELITILPAPINNPYHFTVKLFSCFHVFRIKRRMLELNDDALIRYGVRDMLFFFIFNEYAHATQSESYSSNPGAIVFQIPTTDHNLFCFDVPNATF